MNTKTITYINELLEKEYIVIEEEMADIDKKLRKYNNKNIRLTTEQQDNVERLMNTFDKLIEKREKLVGVMNDFQKHQW